MDSVEQQLLLYDELPASERAELNAHLAANPEAQAVVEEGRRLRRLLREATRAGADVPDAEMVALYLAAQYMAHRPLPPDLQVLGERVEAALEAHPEIERRYSMMRDRLKTLVAEGESPRAQFERLTGRRLTAPAGGSSDKQPAGMRPPVVPARTVQARQAGTRRRVFSRFALAAVLVGAMLYGALFVISSSTRSPYERLADLEAAPGEFEGLRLRGPAGQADPSADHYAAALEHLHDARNAFLGLFPSYDAEGLEAAVRELNGVVEIEPPDAALGLEARYLIGRIRLHQGDVEAARRQLQIVVLREGPSAPDAQRLLDALEPVPPVREE